ncbi:polysaccharide biosynthesis C-terminal domain-containing protein [Dactylosporangium siamense]|uniref:Polysaccharide biosynthesis protein n=1 Tax=Dactylosporangium siamense TaxID=685454 RepID=A0A919UG47_9ACTN|nr:polysaccharide biosynthesis C-terminal domain-containing protein [Dactylosporangium siamense]GIG50260.1 polysaccharide biosynthesis protein [Dactylosporangium siamense]
MVSTQAASKLARSAAVLVGRKIAVSAMSATASVIVVRSLLPEQFGQYAAGLAAFYVLLALTDFGLGEVLGRSLGRRPEGAQHRIRVVLRVHLTWSATVALGGLAFAVLVGIGTIRGGVLLALIPAVAVAGASCLRQVFYARHAVGRLATLDLMTTAASTVGLIVLAVADAPPFLLAAVASLAATINSLLVIRLAWPLTSSGDVVDADGLDARTVVSQAAPIGVASFLASAYFSIDVVLLASLLPAEDIGRYAAAVKVLTILIMVPGVVMGMALPQVSAELIDRARVTALLAQVWHWFASLVLPGFVLVSLYAATAMGLLFGPHYVDAAPLLRILMLAGVVQMCSQVLSVVVVAAARSAWLIGQNILALVINVGGNLLLTPRFGMAAAAWLTVLTELTVCVGSCWALRHRLDLGPLLRMTAAPALAMAPMVGVWSLLPGRPWVSIPLCCLAYLITLTALRGWPTELTAALLKWRKLA